MLITIHEVAARVSGGCARRVLRAKAGYMFAPVMSQPASVWFKCSTELMTSLTFEQDGKAVRFVRVR